MKHAKPKDWYYKDHIGSFQAYSRRVCRSAVLVYWSARVWTLGDSHWQGPLETTRERFGNRVMSGRSPYWDRGLLHHHRTQEGYQRWLTICWKLPTPGDVALYIGRGLWIDLKVAELMAKGIAS